MAGNERAQLNLKTKEQMRLLEQKVDQLDKENAKLTEQRKEVIGMNKRWKKFNNMREAHITRLSNTSYQQQSKIIVLEQQCSELNEEISKLNKLNAIGLNKKWQKFNDQREAHITKLSKTSYQQLSKIIVLEQRCSELNEEISELKKDRDVALVSVNKQLIQKDEEIVMLKSQLQKMRHLVQNLEPRHPTNVDDKEKIERLRDAPTFTGCRSPTHNTQTSCKQIMKARDNTDTHYYGEDILDIK